MKDNRIITLIAKMLQHQASPDEARELEQWEQGSAANQKEAEAFRKTWDISGKYDHQMKPDVEAGLSRLKNRIDKDRRTETKAPVKPARARRFNLPGMIMKVAAAAAIIYGIGFLGKTYLQPSSRPFMVATEVGQTEKVELTDGSIVYLNQKSSLEFTNPNNRTERRARLQGEAFFEVAKDPSRPFIIETDGAKVEVLGTSFNVRALPGEALVEVQVKTGQVAVTASETNQELNLMTNEKAILDKSGGKLSKETDPSLNALAWHSGQLQFKNTPLEKVMTDLERYYGVQIEVTDRELLTCGFTSPFTNADLSTVLETIKTAFGMELEKVNSKNYRLKAGTCN